MLLLPAVGTIRLMGLWIIRMTERWFSHARYGRGRTALTTPRLIQVKTIVRWGAENP